jgi:hypothetical protein
MRGGWLARLCGYSPTSGHAELSWAADSGGRTAGPGITGSDDAQAYAAPHPWLTVNLCHIGNTRVVAGIVSPVRPRRMAGPPVE